MKKELFKVSYSRYFSEEYSNHLQLDEIHKIEIENSIDRKGIQREIFRRKDFDTTEETYLSNYGNPLYSVYRENIMIVVEREGNKVSIKFFNSSRKRRVGKSWFQVKKSMNYITVNVDMGDVYVGSLTNYQKKKCQKKITRNFFRLDNISNFRLMVKHAVGYFNQHIPDFNSTEVVVEALSKFMYEIDQIEDFSHLTFNERLYKFYLNKKGIKHPDNLFAYMKCSFNLPKLKELRKNDMKYVDTFMQMNNLSGKKIRKALHICSDINISLYKIATEFFGDDWINQNEDVLLACLNSSYKPWFSTQTSLREVFSHEELKRVFSVFKQAFVYETLDYSTFFDHLRIYIELKAYGEQDIRWYSCDDKDEFRKEHLDWTDKLQHYKHGTYTRIYPEYMHEVINQPIKVDEEIYHPVLLTNSSLYNSESQQQSNCVKGYIGRAGSIIVSLRKGEQESDDRGTIEYRLEKKDNKILVSRVQYLGRFNMGLSSEWSNVLSLLDKTMEKCISDKRYSNVKIIKECTNGAVLKSDSDWSIYGRLDWTYKNIEGNNNFDINF